MLQLEHPVALEALRGRPSQPWLWLSPAAGLLPARSELQGRGIRLYRRGDGYDGDVRCGLPLPLPVESVQAIVVEHAAQGSAGDFLDECARVLMPGGRLWLFALNPLSPYRLHWARHGVAAIRPDRLRSLAQRAGLQCVGSPRYLGPMWQLGRVPSGPGRAPWRAVCLLELEKRSVAAVGPTPLMMRWQRPAITI